MILPYLYVSEFPNQLSEFINILCENTSMNINPISINNSSVIHQAVNMKLLRKSLDVQKNNMNQIINMMNNSGIGKNVDIKI